METDRELLELAAKASGVHLVWYENGGLWPVYGTADGKPTSYGWNPLTDDGDALRLAVKLGMVVDFRQEGYELADQIPGAYLHVVIHDKKDPYAATRRAIVRAAAEIGSGMK